MCDKDGEKAQHSQLSFLRNRLRRLKSPQLGELCFVLKIEFPAFFSCQMSLLKKKKKQSFINGLPKLAEDLRDKQDRGTSYEGIFVQVPSPHF